MNDDRPIEKLLRRYANKRRDEAGAPVEMHPATRRLLQGEVASQFKRQNSKGKSAGRWEEGRRFFGFAFLTDNLPRLAWALPLFALAGIGLWSLVGLVQRRRQRNAPGGGLDFVGLNGRHAQAGGRSLAPSVSTSWPVSVTRIVCSHWAESE